MELKVENVSDKEYRLMVENKKLIKKIDVLLQNQQLISFLEDKIKENENKKSKSDFGLDIVHIKGKLVAFQEVLDFVNKDGKDE